LVAAFFFGEALVVGLAAGVLVVAFLAGFFVAIRVAPHCWAFISNALLAWRTPKTGKTLVASKTSLPAR
jgi:hypothetical protein